VSARVWLVLLLVVAALFCSAGAAEAQFQPRGAPRPTADAPPADGAEDADQAAKKVEDPEKAKRKLKSSKWLALVFWAFAFMVVGGSIFVLTRRNLIAAVMGMVGTFFAIAAVYAMLFAHFLAVIQVLVYAGAIMVLFVFVIMILNKSEDQPWSRQAWPGKALAIAAAAYLLFRMGSVLWSAHPPDPERGKPPADLVIRQVAGDETPKMAPFGSTKAVGKTLFQDYLFPFEAISLVLLVAVVGALAVARPHHEKHDGGAGTTEPHA
jgi:NADH-quinone oxidoreductase subunit J